MTIKMKIVKWHKTEEEIELQLPYYYLREIGDNYYNHTVYGVITEKEEIEIYQDNEGYHILKQKHHGDISDYTYNGCSKELFEEELNNAIEYIKQITT